MQVLINLALNGAWVGDLEESADFRMLQAAGWNVEREGGSRLYPEFVMASIITPTGAPLYEMDTARTCKCHHF